MEKYKLYKKKIVLEYDHDSHQYRVNDEIVYGVTSITNVISKPALMYWAVNETIKFFKEGLKGGEVLSEVDKQTMLKNAKFAHRGSSTRSKVIGTVVHEWIEKYIKAKMEKKKAPKKPTNKKAKSSVNAFLKWIKDGKMKLIETESKVYSKEYQYAGTLDAVIKKGKKKYVVDFKTSSGIYDNHWYQVAAYHQAREEEAGEKVDGGMIVRVGKIDGELEVKTKTRKQLKPYLRVFLGANEVYKGQNDVKDAK